MALPRRHVLKSASFLAATPALYAAFGASVAYADDAQARIDPESAEWVLVPSLTDDFSALDENRWRRGMWYPESWGAGTFTAENSVIRDGVLRLEARDEPNEVNGRTIPMTFGAVESRFDVPGLSSYIEVRARCLDTANILSAIWLQSSTLTGEDRLLSDPNPEIDVHESVRDTNINWAHHLWPWDPENNRHERWDKRPNGGEVPAGADLSADFHLYGVERREGRVRLYLDRVLYADIDAQGLGSQFSSLWRMSRHVVLSLEGHSRSPHNIAALPRSFDIDYVRTYAYLPLDADVTGQRILSGPDGKVLTVRDGQLAVEPAQDDQPQWTFTKHDDLTYEISSQGLYLAQTEHWGWDDYDLPVHLRAEGGAGPDDASSLARWHVQPAGEGRIALFNKVSGLPLMLRSEVPESVEMDDEAPVVVHSSQNATPWTVSQPQTPENPEDPGSGNSSGGEEPQQPAQPNQPGQSNLGGGEQQPTAKPSAKTGATSQVAQNLAKTGAAAAVAAGAAVALTGAGAALKATRQD